MGFSKQPTLRVIVAELQHCLAKAWLILLCHLRIFVEFLTLLKPIPAFPYGCDLLPTCLLAGNCFYFWIGRKMNLKIAGTKKPSRAKRGNEGASRRRPEGRLK